MGSGPRDRGLVLNALEKSTAHENAHRNESRDAPCACEESSEPGTGSLDERRAPSASAEEPEPEAASRSRASASSSGM